MKFVASHQPSVLPWLARLLAVDACLDLLKVLGVLCQVAGVADLRRRCRHGGKLMGDNWVQIAAAVDSNASLAALALASEGDRSSCDRLRVYCIRFPERRPVATDVCKFQVQSRRAPPSD